MRKKIKHAYTHISKHMLHTTIYIYIYIYSYIYIHIYIYIYSAVVVKPPGVVVHKEKGAHARNTVKTALAFLLTPSGATDPLWRPIPCHRLDGGTGGLLVAAKTRTAAAEISRQFEMREVCCLLQSVRVCYHLERVCMSTAGSWHVCACFSGVFKEYVCVWLRVYVSICFQDCLQAMA